MADIKVSVIIPVYNVEKYLRQNLESVQKQTLKDIEIICVDDGSTDSSCKIAEEFAAADSRFVVIKQQTAAQARQETTVCAMQRENIFLFLIRMISLSRICLKSI